MNIIFFVSLVFYLFICEVFFFSWSQKYTKINYIYDFIHKCDCMSSLPTCQLPKHQNYGEYEGETKKKKFKVQYFFRVRNRYLCQIANAHVTMLHATCLHRGEPVPKI
jgi:hypothetical protein